MSTGARPDQIEAAIESRLRWVFAVDDTSGLPRMYAREVHLIAPHLVPPGSAIIAAEDVAAIRLVSAMFDAVAVLKETQQRNARRVATSQSACDEVNAAGYRYKVAYDAITPDVLDRLRRIGGEG